MQDECGMVSLGLDESCVPARLKPTRHFSPPVVAILRRSDSCVAHAGSIRVCIVRRRRIMCASKDWYRLDTSSLLLLQVRSPPRYSFQSHRFWCCTPLQSHTHRFDLDTLIVLRFLDSDTLFWLDAKICKCVVCDGHGVLDTMFPWAGSQSAACCGPSLVRLRAKCEIVHCVMSFVSAQACIVSRCVRLW